MECSSIRLSLSVRGRTDARLGTRVAGTICLWSAYTSAAVRLRRTGGREVGEREAREVSRQGLLIAPAMQQQSNVPATCAPSMVSPHAAIAPLNRFLLAVVCPSSPCRCAMVRPIPCWAVLSRVR